MNYSFYIDIHRCTGCQACVVSCMDQNDVDVAGGEDSYRHVHQLEEGRFPHVKNAYISMACMHCEDAPCVTTCPTGAIEQDGRGAVLVDTANCIGCHTCLQSCPFGAPRFDKNGKMAKCDMCLDRVLAGLEPACVRTCPTRALKFGLTSELGKKVETAAARKLVFP